MSTPLWHCSEISILLSGSAKACPSSAHQMKQQWQDEHSTEHPLLAPWKAVTWLPQHPKHPPRLWWPVGESQDHKVITQKDSAVNLNTPLESNLEDAAIAERFLQRGKLVQYGQSPTCPPLWAWHWQSDPTGREGWKDHPCFKRFVLRLQIVTEQLRVVPAAPGTHWGCYHPITAGSSKAGSTEPEGRIWTEL